MKILVVGSDVKNGYPGVFCEHFRKALNASNVAHDFQVASPNFTPRSGYDIYIGAGDELFRRMPETVYQIKKGGGIVLDARTKKLPNKPKTLLNFFFQSSDFKADFILSHTPSKSRNCFYIGQGFDQANLYPQHDEYFTVLVDHYMPKRRAKVQSILDQCKQLFEFGNKVRIWYHNSNGIAENIFEEDRTQYKALPYEKIASYYRKTHCFLPTHRETQGIVAAEVGLCGGITLLEPWMYPKYVIQKIPHVFYRNKISWPESVDIRSNMDLASKNFGMMAYSSRIKSTLEEIYRKTHTK